MDESCMASHVRVGSVWMSPVRMSHARYLLAGAIVAEQKDVVVHVEPDVERAL